MDIFIKLSSASRALRQWFNDESTREWRHLLFGLQSCCQLLLDANDARNSDLLRQAVQRGYRLIRGRAAISARVCDRGLEAHWDEIRTLAYNQTFPSEFYPNAVPKEDNALHFAVRQFSYRVAKLPGELGLPTASSSTVQRGLFPAAAEWRAFADGLRESIEQIASNRWEASEISRRLENGRRYFHSLKLLTRAVELAGLPCEFDNFAVIVLKPSHEFHVQEIDFAALLVLERLRYAFDHAFRSGSALHGTRSSGPEQQASLE